MAFTSIRRVTYSGAGVLLLVLIACGGGGGGSGGDPIPAGAWTSSLFPASWTPQFTDGSGRFLHDVSYAGYRGGEAPLSDGAGLPVIDVVIDHSADATGASDATAAVQAAIDAAEALPGAIVFFPQGIYRIDGLLTLTDSNVILRGAGPALSRLHFTRHTTMSDTAHLSVGTSPSTGLEVALAQDATPRQADVFVADASGLSVGDDVALGFVITPTFIDEHGMTGTWGPFNGTWQPFERRDIVAIDMGQVPHRVTLDVPVRYPALTRDSASLRVESGYLREVGIEHLGVATGVGWDDAWDNERSHVIKLTGVADAWVRDVHSFVSPNAPTSGAGTGGHLQNCGVAVIRSKRVTIADCRMEQAQHRGGGGCGYLFELRQSNEVLTRDCVAVAGRHNYIQNWGFGTSGCVWLRCHSEQGLALFDKAFPTLGQLGYSEFHHSLATANLIDSCSTTDGWSGTNRGSFSSGAGHSATQNVWWNLRGTGRVRSQQFGWGYIIGTDPGITVETAPGSTGTAPTDMVEGAGTASELTPQSLYIEQHTLRTGSAPEAATP